MLMDERLPMPRMLFLFAILIPLFLFCGVQADENNPRIWLWAWQRAENLQSIDTSSVGVAYLAQTLTLTGNKVSVDPRLQPLLVPDGTAIVAVTRIQVKTSEPASLSPEQIGRIVKLICRTAAPHVVAVQIDFDARQSERQFYLRLLQSLRSALPSPWRISMTALASWSTFDNWLKDAPVDEKVPMFFSMGADKGRVLSFLQEGRSVLPSFQSSVGVSVDDMDTAKAVLAAPTYQSVGNVYCFTRKPWSQRSLASVGKLGTPR
jgi:hypothetical protein